MPSPTILAPGAVHVPRASRVQRLHAPASPRPRRFLFWWDLATTVPWDGIVTAGLRITSRTADRRALYVGLLRWLKLGRLYRIFDLFAMLEHKMIVSQIVLVRGGLAVASGATCEHFLLFALSVQLQG